MRWGDLCTSLLKFFTTASIKYGALNGLRTINETSFLLLYLKNGCREN